MNGGLITVDNDFAGKKALHTLTKSVGLRQYEDVIVLRHRLPRVTQDPHDLMKRIEEANSAWPRLDCEIEDFVDQSLLRAFAAEFPGASVGHPDLHEGAHHFNWAGHLKPRLASYVREYAQLSDVQPLLRFLLRLPPDGVQAAPLA